MTLRTARLLPFALLAAPALADVPPEVMLLIDTSSAMSGDVDLNGAYRPLTCEPVGADEPDAARSYPRSRLMVTQDVLTGTTRFKHWCVEHTPEFRAQGDAVGNGRHSLGADGLFSHYRAMCCETINNGNCTAWRACGRDSGDDGGANDAVSRTVGVALGTAGVVHRLLHRIKFGVLTMDTHPNRATDANGHYSYGTDDYPVPAPISGTVGGATARNLAPGAAGNNNPGLGARSAGAPFGTQVQGNRGVMNAGVVDALEPVPDDEPELIRQHNRYVMDRIRSIVPFGAAAPSAMLDDLRYYYLKQSQTDDAFACRKRIAVMVASGPEGQLYGGQACVDDNACGEGGACVDTATLADPLRACSADRDCAAGDVCRPHLTPTGPALLCGTPVKACRYHSGYPYPAAADAAQALYESGVPVYVIGVGLSANPDDPFRKAAYDIAVKGSPELGPEADQPGFFQVNSADEMAVAFDRITNAALAGFVSRGQPLVLSPGPRELEYYEDNNRRDKIVQYRFTTFSEIPGSGDSAHYGRIRMAERGCREDDKRQTTEVGAIRYDAVLARRAADRRTVSRQPILRAPFAVNGSNDTLFDGIGDLRRPADEQLARDLLRAPLGDAVNGVLPVDKMVVAGRALSGYFGDRGLPNGLNGAVGTRQLGEIVNGNMVAITPPNKAVVSPAYDRFAERNRDRPVLVAVGARDGLVHLYRAVDGEEVMNFMPRFAWRQMRNGHFDADGPLVADDVADCRAIANGVDECPSEPNAVKFRTLMVGGTGASAPNIFALDMTNLSGQFVEPDGQLADFAVADQFGGDLGRPFLWDVTDDTVNDSSTVVPKLGLAVSKPAITHVREDDQIHAAVIVGCGNDPDANGAERSNAGLKGRCVLVLDGKTGRVIAQIENDQMDRPMVGGVAVYPAGGIAPAERAYIGDNRGRLWRIDLRDSDPARWTAEVAWPPVDVNERRGYEEGREIIDPATLSLREDGRLVVLFGNGENSHGGNAERGYIVSFTEDPTVDADAGTVEYEAKGNWVFPMARREYLSGKINVRAEVALFTTIEDGDAACASAQGRLYGVHYFRPNLDADGDRESFTVGSGADSRTADVSPRLPIVNGDGSIEFALALLLPPGRVAYGLVIVSTPSCLEGAPPSEEVVMNLSDESHGASGAVSDNGLRVERVSGGSVQASALAGRMFTSTSPNELSVCLDCDQDGASTGGKGFGGSSRPFPSVVNSWGSTFSN